MTADATARARRLDVRLPHVHRDAGQRVPLRERELVVEGAEALDLPVLGNELDGRLLEIAHDRVIPMPLAEGLLIDADVAPGGRLCARGLGPRRGPSRPRLHTSG